MNPSCLYRWSKFFLSFFASLSVRDVTSYQRPHKKSAYCLRNLWLVRQIDTRKSSAFCKFLKRSIKKKLRFTFIVLSQCINIINFPQLNTSFIQFALCQVSVSLILQHYSLAGLLWSHLQSSFVPNLWKDVIKCVTPRLNTAVRCLLPRCIPLHPDKF